MHSYVSHLVLFGYVVYTNYTCLLLCNVGRSHKNTYGKVGQKRPLVSFGINIWQWACFKKTQTPALNFIHCRYPIRYWLHYNWFANLLFGSAISSTAFFEKQTQLQFLANIFLSGLDKIFYHSTYTVY